MMRGDVTRTRILPAGEYYIGDPCYVIRREVGLEEWGDMLNRTGCLGLEESDGSWDEGLFEYEGARCWAHGTKYGDGRYCDNKGNDEYEVDAGLLSVIPVSVCYPDNDRNLNSLGHVHIFEREFECWYDNGVFHFGDVVINTGDEYEDEEKNEPFSMKLSLFNGMFILKILLVKKI